MNESSLIENQLRTWKPRQPSERIREALFGEQSASGDMATGLRFGEITRWLVPAMGCFLLVIGSLSPRHNLILRDNRHGLLAFGDSIQAPASINDSNTEQNSVPQLVVAASAPAEHSGDGINSTLESTFRSRSPSSITSFINFRTNTLRH